MTNIIYSGMVKFFIYEAKHILRHPPSKMVYKMTKLKIFFLLWFKVTDETIINIQNTKTSRGHVISITPSLRHCIYKYIYN